MSAGTGFVVAAYLITLAVLVTYGAVLVAGRRWAARQLDAARRTAAPEGSAPGGAGAVRREGWTERTEAGPGREVTHV